MEYARNMHGQIPSYVLCSFRSHDKCYRVLTCDLVLLGHAKPTHADEYESPVWRIWAKQGPGVAQDCPSTSYRAVLCVSSIPGFYTPAAEAIGRRNPQFYKPATKANQTPSSISLLRRLSKPPVLSVSLLRRLCAGGPQFCKPAAEAICRRSPVLSISLLRRLCAGGPQFYKPAAEAICRRNPQFCKPATEAIGRRDSGSSQSAPSCDLGLIEAPLRELRGARDEENKRLDLRGNKQATRETRHGTEGKLPDQLRHTRSPGDDSLRVSKNVDLARFCLSTFYKPATEAKNTVGCIFVATENCNSLCVRSDLILRSRWRHRGHADSSTSGPGRHHDEEIRKPLDLISDQILRMDIRNEPCPGDSDRLWTKSPARMRAARRMFSLHS
ncbi:hypothetical protein Bbelb_120180 [Branchiostoma belcheri]|nr:hypothetical protein Bbelb_120180 [Branchiostoma belcheri]